MLEYLKDDIEKIRNLIAEGANQEAINKLYSVVANNDELQDTVLMLRTRLNALNKSVREGTIGRDEENVERNTINRALLDTLNLLEYHYEHQKSTLTAVRPSQDENPVMTGTHSVKGKQVESKKPLPRSGLLLRGLLALATILVTVLIERSINSWFDGDASSSAGKIPKDLTVRLALRPDYPGIRQSGLAKVAIGKFVSQPRPIPPENILYIANIPPEFGHDTVRLQLSGEKFPCKVVGQSAWSLEISNDITFYIELIANIYTGRVLYPDSKPAAGVEIDVEDGLARDTTDPEGNYTLALPELNARTIQLTVRKQGKAILSRRVGLHPDVLKEIKIPD